MILKRVVEFEIELTVEETIREAMSFRPLDRARFCAVLAAHLVEDVTALKAAFPKFDPQSIAGPLERLKEALETAP